MTRVRMPGTVESVRTWPRSSAQRSSSRQQMMDVMSPMPRVSPLTADYRLLDVGSRALALASLQGGAQCNPSVCVVGEELRTIVRVIFGLRNYNFLGRVDAHWEISDPHEVASRHFV